MSGIDKSAVRDKKKQTKSLKIIKICRSSSNFLQIFQFHRPILQPVTSLKLNGSHDGHDRNLH